MKVDLYIKSDETCWNRDAITEYASAINDQEARMRNNDDIVDVIPGKIACRSCNVNGVLGTVCSAQLTETQYEIRNQRPPLANAAFVAASRAIRGFSFVKPGSK